MKCSHSRNNHIASVARGDRDNSQEKLCGVLIDITTIKDVAP